MYYLAKYHIVLCSSYYSLPKDDIKQRYDKGYVPTNQGETIRPNRLYRSGYFIGKTAISPLLLFDNPFALREIYLWNTDRN